MASSSFLLFFFFFFLLLCSTFIPSNSHDSSKPITSFGFAVPLIHRDSPQSPFYNHSMTPHDRHLAAYHRSVSRLNHLSSSANSQSAPLDGVSTSLVPDDLEYTISFYVGTPPKPTVAFIDTSSDLIWIKGLPYFDPLNSSSYATLSCGSVSCNYLGSHRRLCSNFDQPCSYSSIYAGGSVSVGTLSRDKFTLFDNDPVGPADLGFFDFGYSFMSSPRFNANRGVIGLNRKNLSFIHQLGVNKFSHCMVAPDDAGGGISTMYFGSLVGLSDEITPMLNGKRRHYYVTLNGITIGDQEVPLPRGVFNLTQYGEGGLIVDSGSGYTMLRTEGFEPFLSVLHSVMRQNVRHFPIAEIPAAYSYFELCIEVSDLDVQFLPMVIFHFPGANVKLMPENTFVQFRPGVRCLAILRSVNYVSVLGNIQMRNKLVEYDLEMGFISFDYKDCSAV